MNGFRENYGNQNEFTLLNITYGSEFGENVNDIKDMFNYILLPYQFCDSEIIN